MVFLDLKEEERKTKREREEKKERRTIEKIPKSSDFKQILNTQRRTVHERIFIESEEIFGDFEKE